MEYEESFVILKNITKRYEGVLALNNVDFDIKRGEVHCLVGENGSGKSTLVKIMTGVISPEPGAEIVIGGEKIDRLTPFDAFKRGIHVVHQDLSLFPNLSVAENICAHFYIEKGNTIVNWKRIRDVAYKTIKSLGVDLDPYSEVERLSVADQQLVAICRAMASEAKVIILDEPTSSLTSKEVNRLFELIRSLTAKGIGILFISHRLDEILEIGDRITIFRNGNKIGTFPKEEMDKRKITTLMTGKEPRPVKPRVLGPNKKEVLRVEHLTKRGEYEDITFSLYEGEILGIIGPRGAGRTEIALSIFGLNPPDSGKIYLYGDLTNFRSNRESIKAGIGYVPENRLLQGLVLDHSIENNIAITNLEKILGLLNLINQAKKTALAKKAVTTFDIKTINTFVPVKTLSGGNQQKVVLAKWILTTPKILILDSPTNGVDVGAKESIHNLIKELSEKGISIIMISDEETEIMQNCTRTLIMRDGHIIGDFPIDKITEEELKKFIQEKDV